MNTECCSGDGFVCLSVAHAALAGRPEVKLCSTMRFRGLVLGCSVSGQSCDHLDERNERKSKNNNNKKTLAEGILQLLLFNYRGLMLPDDEKKINPGVGGHTD